jgi:hypothetical protein
MSTENMNDFQRALARKALARLEPARRGTIRQKWEAMETFMQEIRHMLLGMDGTLQVQWDHRSRSMFSMTLDSWDENDFQNRCQILVDWVSALVEHADPSAKGQFATKLNLVESIEKRVFIGHGRSKLWTELKDFLQDSLHLKWEEFNRESAAGFATTERLSQMLDAASFALLVMTGEDEHSDGKKHPRGNVIHEAGLFQGRLGFKRAIILLEEGCQEFSNIVGLTEIRFPKGDILARSEEIRKVLQREGILAKS